MPIDVITGPAIAPPNETRQYDYDASGNVTYIGTARSRLAVPATVTVTAVSKAASASFTATAHGLVSGQKVTISGTTGDWTGLNGTLAVTVTNANAFTVAVNSSGYSGTYSGLVQTTVPQTSAAVWSIQKNVYDANGLLTQNYWAEGSASPDKVWDSRTTYSFQ